MRSPNNYSSIDSDIALLTHHISYLGQDDFLSNNARVNTIIQKWFDQADEIPNDINLLMRKLCLLVEQSIKSYKNTPDDAETLKIIRKQALWHAEFVKFYHFQIRFNEVNSTLNHIDVKNINDTMSNILNLMDGENNLKQLTHYYQCFKLLDQTSCSLLEWIKEEAKQFKVHICEEIIEIVTSKDQNPWDQITDSSVKFKLFELGQIFHDTKPRQIIELRLQNLLDSLPDNDSFNLASIIDNKYSFISSELKQDFDYLVELNHTKDQDLTGKTLFTKIEQLLDKNLGSYISDEVFLKLRANYYTSFCHGDAITSYNLMNYFESRNIQPKAHNSHPIECSTKAVPTLCSASLTTHPNPRPIITAPIFNPLQSLARPALLAKDIFKPRTPFGCAAAIVAAGGVVAATAMINSYEKHDTSTSHSK